jgi:CRP-like cAMP-binding protein
MRKTIRTVEVAVTLALTTEELRTLLSDNTDLVRGLFSTLAGRVDPATVSNVQSTGAAGELENLASDGLLPVEKILALQRVPVFSRMAVEEMRPLAEVAHTVTMTPGSPLFSASGPVSLWLLLSGEVSLDDHAGGQTAVARAGDIIGSLSMLSGREIGQSADVLRSGIALRIDREDLFDLLGERPELLRQMFEGMFRMGDEAAGATPGGVGV